MYLRKSLKGFQLIIGRQKLVNWCQLSATRRHLSDNRDNDDNSEDNIIKRVDKQIGRDLKTTEESQEDRSVRAEQCLNQLIDSLKSKQTLGPSDERLKKILAKPKTHIRQSAREEIKVDDKIEDIRKFAGNIDERLVLAAKGIARTLRGEQSKRTEEDLMKLLKLQNIETNYAKKGRILPKEKLSSILSEMKVIKEEPKEQYFTPLAPKVSKNENTETNDIFGNNSKRGKTIADFVINDVNFDDSDIGIKVRHKTVADFTNNTNPFQEELNFEFREGTNQLKQTKPFQRQRKTYVDMDSKGQSVSHSLMSEDLEEMTVSKTLFQNRQKRQTSSGQKHNLFTGEDIGIFEANMKEAEDLPKLLIWDRLLEEELRDVVAQPPMNAFEEMIQWTEEGKLWKYPINNEQGLEEEENVPFYEHVLLDHLLDGFPESGPIRKFIELVIIGLSSNPYISVERKHATVQYYRQYFNENKDLLQVAGALTSA
ncbi:uncharacterized protein LOC128961396 [Oppia nitens]|uniref:uncharacterized protein LOC128961396 n=1 Tax=Oppia nitens TaxID=1686743 RepID=UPI0023DBAE76|nr:uncharacterized protein LOC128961396 [Oppia nitens]